MSSQNNEILNGFKKTEIGIIPEEWEVVKLGDVATINSGGNAPQGEEYFKGGKYPFIRVQHFDGSKNYVDRWDLINELAVERYKLKLFPKHSIIFPKSGASIRLEKRAMLPIDAYVVSHLCIVNPNTKADNLFLFYLLKKVKFTQQSGGTTLPYLNLESISNKKIPLPPLPEQRKIAHVLSTIQEAKEKTEAVIKAAKELKKSLMKYLFTYGPVPLNEAENVKLKETEIGLIPEGWEVVKLGDVVREKITDGVHKTPKYVEKGIPFITAKDIINNKIDFRNCKFISVEEHKNLIKRVKPERGDILLTKVGTVGNVAMVEDNKEFSIFVQVALIKPDYNKVHSPYLKYALLSKNVQIDIINKSAQSTMKFIGTQKIAKISIPLPPLPVQQKIASILSAVDEKIEKEENKKKALEELFKSMLHNLMTGKVRVKDLDIGVDEERKEENDLMVDKNVGK